MMFIPSLVTAGWFWQNPRPQGNSLWCVYFIDNSIGYAVGAGGTILKTTDGGLSWINQISNTIRSLNSVHFPVDANIGYVVGDSGPNIKDD